MALAGAQDARRVVVVGGGVAGVACAESISQRRPDFSVTILTAGAVVKDIVSITRVSTLLENFDLRDRAFDEFSQEHPFIQVLRCEVLQVDPDRCVVETSVGALPFDDLVLACGGSPKLIFDHPRVMGLRDVQSVLRLQRILSHRGTFAIVGNGGIALDLVQSISNCSLHWIVKDAFFGYKFLDRGISRFFQDRLFRKDSASGSGVVVSRAPESSPSGAAATQSESELPVMYGSAVGPNWTQLLRSVSEDRSGGSHFSLSLNLGAAIVAISIEGGEWRPLQVPQDPFDPPKAFRPTLPVALLLSTGEVVECDYVLSATGIVPNTSFLKGSKLGLDEDGFLRVDSRFRVLGRPNVYAIGDVCKVLVPEERSGLWFQSPLWTQARQMGVEASKEIIGADELERGILFELFTHITYFEGLKGNFNAQLSNPEIREFVQFGYVSEMSQWPELPESFHGRMDSCLSGHQVTVCVRIAQQTEFVKLFFDNGRMQGAILVGETDLEECVENLILNQMDVSYMLDWILDPRFALADYFD